MQSVGEQTYSQAVREGKYDLYVGNLFGKYDNVRTYWEDQLTRIALRPFLGELVEQRGQKDRGLRIVDLGCGAGQGYQILTKIDRRDLDLGLQHQRVLPKEKIDLYLGLDISQAMVEKGQILFESEPQVEFAQADLREGLGKFKTDTSQNWLCNPEYGFVSPLHRGRKCSGSTSFVAVERKAHYPAQRRTVKTSGTTPRKTCLTLPPRT